MKKEIKLSPMPYFEAGKTDMFFDKKGLQLINFTSGNWTYEAHTKTLSSKSKILNVEQLCPRKVGDAISVLSTNSLCWISEINLIRLTDVTDEMAIRSGVEMISTGFWKHYAPELFYPKKLLKKADKEKIGYSTPRGSFFSRWCKENAELMDIYSNPWIWQYVCVAELKSVEVNIGPNEESFRFTYNDLEKMASYIMDRFLVSGEQRPVTVSSEEFGEIIWDHTLAHYCYAHGRITEREFVRILFKKEDVETVLNEREMIHE